MADSFCGREQRADGSREVAIGAATRHRVHLRAIAIASFAAM
jgi:hypothetical protein